MSPLVPIRLSVFVAIVGVSVLAVPSARADYSPDQHKADLKLLEDAKQPHTDAALLDFFRKRLINPKDQARIEELIVKLASKSFKEREAATTDLVNMGPPALPFLRKVLNSTVELEMKRRCDRCVKEIEKKSPNTLVTAAARLLRARQTPGACAMLLEYVAVAPDDIVQEEVYASIYHLALAGAKLEVFPPLVKAGKLDQVLVQALNDKEVLRRAIAALIVGQFGTDAQRQLVKELLTDNDADVRFRAAQGLLAARDPSGIPVLVELLHKGPFNVALQAEDLISLAAQEKGPTAPLANTAEARQKCHDAWQAWWEKNKAGLDLTKVDLEAPFGGLSARAGAAAVAFIRAIIKFDPAMVAKTTDVPFSIGGVITFNTREEFDKFLEMNKPGGGPDNIKFKVGKVISAAEYLKGTSEQERGFLEGSRPAQVHVVYVDITEGPGAGRQEAIPLFVRISGGRAKCIGFGIPRNGN
jgi:HEAT repeat protein